MMLLHREKSKQQCRILEDCRAKALGVIPAVVLAACLEGDRGHVKLFRVMPNEQFTQSISASPRMNGPPPMPQALALASFLIPGSPKEFFVGVLGLGPITWGGSGEETVGRIY